MTTTTATAAIKKLGSFASGSASRLQNAWELIAKVLTFSPADERVLPKRNLSVAIEKGGISVAYGSRIFSRNVISGAKEYSFAEGKYPQPEEVASSAALSMNEFGISGTEVTLSIPKSWSIIKTAEFPSSVKENLAAAIGYEMDRLTPFTAEEAYFDFKVLRETAEKITVLLMAARLETIRPYISALQDGGLNVTALSVNLAGMCALCRHAEKNSDSIFLNVEEGGFEGALSVNGSLRASFSQSFTDEDDNGKAERIIAEVRAVAAASNGRRNLPVLASLHDNCIVLKEPLRSGLGMPFKVLAETDMKLGLGTAKRIPYSSVGSVLHSLWSKSDGFNLLKKGQVAKQKTPILLTLILAAGIVAATGFYMMQPLKLEEKKLAEIERQLGPRKQEVKKVEALKKELEALENDMATIRQFKESRPLSLNIVKELTAVIPKTAWLSRVRVTETGVEIEGHTGASATELLPKLEASKLFRKAEFGSPTFRDAKTAQERFNIKMEIEGSKKLEDMVKKEEAPGKSGAKSSAQGVKDEKK